MRSVLFRAYWVWLEGEDLAAFCRRNFEYGYIVDVLGLREEGGVQVAEIHLQIPGRGSSVCVNTSWLSPINSA